MTTFQILLDTTAATMAKDLGMVMLVALVLGAGLPAIFALGMRATTIGRTVSADGEDSTGTMSLTGRTLSSLCFGVVILAALAGIAFIVAGNQIMARLGA